MFIPFSSRSSTVLYSLYFLPFNVRCRVCFSTYKERNYQVGKLNVLVPTVNNDVGFGQGVSVIHLSRAPEYTRTSGCGRFAFRKRGMRIGLLYYVNIHHLTMFIFTGGPHTRSHDGPWYLKLNICFGHVPNSEPSEPKGECLLVPFECKLGSSYGLPGR